jgi:23S rRNA (cytosine1962-C5)-methyltransferase
VRPSDPQRRGGEYRVTDDVARRILAGHPWVYRDSLGGRPITEGPGALLTVISSGNRAFVARGYADPEHPAGIRVLTCDEAENVHPGSGAIAQRFARAQSLRFLLLGSSMPTATRLFAGDSEGLPGVTVDRYGDFVVVQWLAPGALRWRDELLEAIGEHARPRGIYEQKRLRSLAGQAPMPAERVAGEAAPLEVVVEEAGCRFSVDVTAPLGVGFYPDLRLGRDLVASYGQGRRVLNLFAYTGAFSVRALKAGATAVTAVDVSAKGHARARRNLELSGLDPQAMEAVTADALKTLERYADRGRRFDLVICDPPTFAHAQNAGGPFQVARDMPELAAACVRVLDPGGLLAFSTNSVKLTGAELEWAMGEGAGRAKADLRVVGRAGLPADFPVRPAFPEGNYLKFALAVRA